MNPTKCSCGLHRLVVVLPLALALTALAPPQNDVPLSNDGEFIFPLPTPTVGSTPGAWGELYWRALPGDRLLAHAGPGGAQTMEIAGFYELLADSDWSTTPSFHDRYVGPASPTFGACGLEPAFLQSGLTSEVLVSIGSSGFGSPCTLYPSLCSPPGSTCAPLGGPWGWIVDIALGATPGSGVVVPADGTAASDLAVTYLLPGGMTTVGGPCGQGDYVYQLVHSVDETQVDDCHGVSRFGGIHTPATGSKPDPANTTIEQMVAFREPILNVVADSGLGVEVGENGGGALNGLKLDTSGGNASIGFEVRDLAGIGQWALVFGDFSPLGPPAVPYLGAHLLVRPTRDVPLCFRGPVVSTVFLFTTEGAFTTCQEPLPALAQTRDVWWQALIFDAASGTARNTNRVRTTLY